MRVEMTFDDAAIAAHGYTHDSIIGTVKAAFAKHSLPCVSDSNVLVFADAGEEEDYANMWNLIIALLRRDWFVDCAASCVFIDDDDSEEDVLCQAWKARRMLA